MNPVLVLTVGGSLLQFVEGRIWNDVSFFTRATSQLVTLKEFDFSLVSTSISEIGLCLIETSCCACRLCRKSPNFVCLLVHLQDKYPSIVSLPGGSRSEVMTVSHPELPG